MISDFFEGLLDNLAAAISLIVLSLIVLTLTGVTLAYYNSDATHEACMIEDKESISTGNGHEYRVYTDCGNFVVQDEFFAKNFHASDTYRDLEEGHAYDLRTRGWRVEFLSWFPNVYQATSTGETAR